MIDITVSMDEWILFVKNNVKEIIEKEIKNNPMHSFFIGIVGYRDINDKNRFIRKDFLPYSEIK